MISKSYVATNFGKLLSALFRGLDMCFGVKLSYPFFDSKLGFPVKIRYENPVFDRIQNST